MKLRRIKKDEVGWKQVNVLCLDYFTEDVSVKSLQDSVSWRLISVDNDFFYLGKTEHD